MDPKLFENIFPKNVCAIFTDKTMDFILPAQFDGFSVEQKVFLSERLQFDPQKIFTMRQVHGNKVLVIRAGDIPQSYPVADADAMVTNVPGIILSMRTADCLPVFLYDQKVKCIGVVHAGWKSSSLKIVSCALEVLAKNYGSDPADVLVAFGPAIRECCYEIGQELEQAFPGEIRLVNNRRCLNLPLVNKNQLVAAGVKMQNIFDCGACTVCGRDFFSFRRDQEKSGRHLSLMALR